MLDIFKFEFGHIVTDTFSGFTGKVDGVCAYQDYCEYRVVGTASENGEIPVNWIDENRLELVSEE